MPDIYERREYAPPKPDQLFSVSELDFAIFRGEGLGYGLGPVGVQNRLVDPEDPLTHEILDVVAEELLSPELLQPVDADEKGKPINDDGCSDGRTAVILKKFGESRLKFAKLRRKVFGGGLTMGMATIIGNGLAKGGLNDVYEQAHDKFALANINYGAHTEIGKDTGCGATDYAPTILSLGIEHEAEIREDIISLANPEKDNSELGAIIDIAFHNIRQYVGNNRELFQNYDPKKVTESIVERKKAVAELGNEHHEVAIVFNIDIENSSTDQAHIRDVTRDAAQLFALDIPRLREIAEKAYDNIEEKKIAFVTELIYSFATLATLTKGDLPVVLRYMESKYVDFDNFSEQQSENSQDTLEFVALQELGYDDPDAELEQ